MLKSKTLDFDPGLMMGLLSNHFCIHSSLIYNMAFVGGSLHLASLLCCIRHTKLCTFILNPYMVYLEHVI